MRKSIAFSLPTYAQKAKPAPMKMMETSMSKMKEMHEKMNKGEIQVDAAKMKKLKNSLFTIDKGLAEIQMKGY